MKKLILYALILLLPLISLSQTVKNYKLHFYISFEDSVKMQTGDTNAINNSDICIKLHIDTIDMAYLKKDTSSKIEPQPNSLFIYKGHYITLYLDDLFDLKDYVMLKNYEITSFKLEPIVHRGEVRIEANSNCMTPEQKNWIKLLLAAFKRNPEHPYSYFESNEFAINNINATNKLTKKILGVSGFYFSIKNPYLK